MAPPEQLRTVRLPVVSPHPYGDLGVPQVGVSGGETGARIPVRGEAAAAPQVFGQVQGADSVVVVVVVPAGLGQPHESTGGSPGGEKGLVQPRVPTPQPIVPALVVIGGQAGRKGPFGRPEPVVLRRAVLEVVGGGFSVRMDGAVDGQCPGAQGAAQPRRHRGRTVRTRAFRLSRTGHEPETGSRQEPAQDPDLFPDEPDGSRRTRRFSWFLGIGHFRQELTPPVQHALPPFAGILAWADVGARLEVGQIGRYVQRYVTSDPLIPSAPRFPGLQGRRFPSATV